MKKFKFKLETFLRLKELEERKKMAELAVVVGQVERERAQVRNFFNESNRLLIEQRQNLERGQFDAGYVRLVQNYFYVLERKRKVAERRIDELQEELGEKQQQANEARKKRRVIEILRETKQAEHQHLVKLEETKALDDFNQVKRGKYEYVEAESTQRRPAHLSARPVVPPEPEVGHSQ